MRLSGQRGTGVRAEVGQKAGHSPSLKGQWLHLSSQVLQDVGISSRFSRKPQIQIFKKLRILVYSYLALPGYQALFYILYKHHLS